MFSPLFASQLIGLPVVPLLDLQADTGVTVSDTDKVDAWADQSGNGFNFTQTGTARPALATIGGYPRLQFDGVDDWMAGQNWSEFDNLDSFTAIFAVSGMNVANYGYSLLNKYFEDGSFALPGWALGPNFGVVQTNDSNYVDMNQENQQNGIWTYTFVRTPLTFNLYHNGVQQTMLKTDDSHQVTLAGNIVTGVDTHFLTLVTINSLFTIWLPPDSLFQGHVVSVEDDTHLTLDASGTIGAPKYFNWCPAYPDGQPNFLSGTVGSYSNSSILSLGTTSDHSDNGNTYGYFLGNVNSIRFYSPALSAAQRVAVGQELANRYGMIL